MTANKERRARKREGVGLIERNDESDCYCTYARCRCEDGEDILGPDYDDLPPMSVG